MKFLGSFIIGVFCAATVGFSENWPQGMGPNGDFAIESGEGLPVKWSASLDENIAWRTTLPETGQSTPVVWGDRVFLTTMKPVEADATVGSDTVAYCLSATDGKILWERPIAGGCMTKLSGPFSDASSPPAMTDGTHVWFLNPTGRMVCFDFEGSELWNREVTSCARTQPMLFDGKLIFHKQVYLPDEKGHFDHSNKDAPLEKWTQLQALDAKSGDPVWESTCGVNMGSCPMVQHLDDGTAVIVVGRGGGHGPPEPEGISMISAADGKTIWSLELPGYMSTQTFPIANGQALIFHKTDHLWVDVKSGKISKTVSVVNEMSVRRWTEKGRETVTETFEVKKPRPITQGSNLRVGDFHYFRSYTRNYLGRVNVNSGAVEYLELPLQVLREKGADEQVLWNAEHRKADLEISTNKKTKKGLSYTSLKFNDMLNSRGFKVSGDARDIGNGWGHTASAAPTAFGNRLIVPLLSGVVFVIQADAEVLDEKAVIAINDLGALGQAYSRASVSTNGSLVFGRTIREVIAFGE